MTSLLHWLRSLRRTESVTAAEIRHRLHELREQHAVTVQQRDAVALDAVNDETAAQRWSHLDGTALELTQRLQVLGAALPAAEAREAEAIRQAEERARANRMREFERTAADAQKWLDVVLASLPSGEVLTKARDLRDALRTEANGLRTWSSEVQVRGRWTRSTSSMQPSPFACNVSNGVGGSARARSRSPTSAPPPERTDP
jgi:hypothetical protein